MRPLAPRISRGLSISGAGFQPAMRNSYGRLEACPTLILPDLQPSLGDRVRHDSVVAGAAAMLGDVESAADAIAIADFAEVDQRVGVGERVPFAERFGDQVVEHRLVRCV